MNLGKIGILLVVLAAGGIANAQAKRYLVSFKSPQAFQSAIQHMHAQAFSEDGSAVSVGIFGGKVRVSKTLEQIQLMVVEADNAKAASALAQHPLIDLVEEEFFHPAPKPLATWGTQIAKGREKSAAVEVPWGIHAVKAPGAWAITKGQSARVMVLDTGVDSAHPSLASRLEKVKNFTRGSSTDVQDQIGHGTHVAGTILADGRDGGLVGVAPQAKLLMGKVCMAEGCSNIAIASGVNWSVQEKVDVVNMSLGGAMISEGEARAIRAAEAAGVMIAAASGNDGTGKVSFPAAMETVMAVGAIDSTLKRAAFSQYGPQLDIVAPGVDVMSAVPKGTGRGAIVKVDLKGKGLSEVKSLPFVGSPLGNSNNQLVFAGLGKTTDFATINVNGKFALIARGEIAFKEKVNNAIAAGAAGVLIFNNAPGLIQGTLTDDGSEAQIPAAMIEQTVGEAARNALNEGRTVTASMSVAATDYAALQGTSMATPHVAGVAALVRAANKNLTPAQVREILTATATPLGPNSSNEYGKGLVNAEAAVAQAAMDLPLSFQVAN